MKELKDISDQHAIEVVKLASNFYNQVEDCEFKVTLRDDEKVIVAFASCQAAIYWDESLNIVLLNMDDDSYVPCFNVYQITDYLRSVGYNIPNKYSPTVEGAEEVNWQLVRVKAALEANRVSDSPNSPEWNTAFNNHISNNYKLIKK